MKRTGPTNPKLVETIEELKKAGKKYNAPVWLRAAELLSRSRRNRAEVNLSKINRYAKTDTVLVPGVVLGCGNITRPITVAAFRFSKNAREKVLRSGGRPLQILELLKENPQGKEVTIII